MVEIAKKQAKYNVWNEVISWVEQGHVLEKAETRGKARDVLVACSMFHPDRRGMVDVPPGVHGQGGLESMSSEQSRRTLRSGRNIE